MDRISIGYSYPLSKAAYEGDLLRTKALVGNCTDINRYDGLGWTPLLNMQFC